MPHYDIAEERRAGEARLVGHIAKVRFASALASGIVVSASLWAHGGPSSFWIGPALALSIAVWPWLAWWLARRAQSPIATERRLAAGDGLFLGFWAAVVGLAPVTDLVLGCMLVSGRIAAGRWPAVVKAVPPVMAGLAAGWLLSGQAWWPDLPASAVMVDLACLVAHICMLSMVMHGQVRELLLHNEELQRQNRTDASIELPNRRYFESRLVQAHSRYRHYRQVASLLLIDVDHFKAVNDRYGHQAGDRILTGVADILRASVRSGDLPARYGGDEFAVLLINANRLAAEHAAQRICRMLASQTLKSGSGMSCTLSIGVAEISMDHLELKDWVNAADAALYRAKAAGRDQVVVA